MLAGGKSLRLGRDKALEQIGGQRLIERVIERLSRLGDDIIVVTASKNQLPDLGVRQVHDCYPGRGALVGIYTGVKEATSSHNLVVACDMPFLRCEPIAFLLGQLTVEDAVIPCWDDDIEPLHAVYATALRPRMGEALRCGLRSVREFLPQISVRYVPEAVMREVRGAEESLRNVNTPEEAARFAVHVHS